MTERVAVIGAGPAGLTAAYALAKSGVGVDIFEADSRVGGLAKTLELWGQKVDLGPHRFFSRNARVNCLWQELMGEDYSLVTRLTRILYSGKFIDYPLNPRNAFSNLGPLETFRCLQSAFFPRTRPDDRSYETWLVNRFGERLYQIFFRDYSEKLWGIPCSEIDADFAAQRIRKFSLFEAMKASLHLSSGENHRTLCEEFPYPNGGSGELYERMSANIQKLSGRIFLKTPIKRVLVENNSVRGVELLTGERLECSRVISSMPLTLLLRSLDAVPLELARSVEQLKFRNTVLVYLRVADEKVFSDQWVYIQSPQLKLGRVTNFRNWGELNASARDTILCLEYWCFEEDPCWSWEEKTWIELAKRELALTGLVKNALPSDGFVKHLARSYPVYRRGYRNILAPIERFLRNVSGLDVIGRYGSFKYNNQDHSILMGLLAAERISQNANHDLWAINSDMESYQEEGKTISHELGRD